MAEAKEGVDERSEEHQDGTSRRVRANGNSKAGAKAALDAKLERRPTFSGSPITGTMTVTELVTRWLEQHGEKIAVQTRDNYQRLLENQIKPGIGNLRVAEASTGRIDTFLRGIAAATPSVARGSRTVLSSAFALAVGHDAIPANPVRETDTITRAKGEIHVLDNDWLAELRAILDRPPVVAIPPGGAPGSVT
jgi:hypothetical protein